MIYSCAAAALVVDETLIRLDDAHVYHRLFWKRMRVMQLLLTDVYVPDDLVGFDLAGEIDKCWPHSSTWSPRSRDA